jgi:hypothetical protein
LFELPPTVMTVSRSSRCTARVPVYPQMGHTEYKGPVAWARSCRSSAMGLTIVCLPRYPT